MSSAGEQQPKRACQVHVKPDKAHRCIVVLPHPSGNLMASKIKSLEVDASDLQLLQQKLKDSDQYHCLQDEYA